MLTEASYGPVVTSEYVYDETVTLTAARTDSTQRAIEVGKRLRSSDGDWGDAVRLRFVTNAVFDDAVDVFEQYDDNGLSFTDATTVALCEGHGIDAARGCTARSFRRLPTVDDAVLSFDDDFDGFVERFDAEAVASE